MLIHQKTNYCIMLKYLSIFIFIFKMLQVKFMAAIHLALPAGTHKHRRTDFYGHAFFREIYFTEF